MIKNAKKSAYFNFILMICSLLIAFPARTENKPAKVPDIHFVPTPHEVVEIMLRLADVKKNDIVYDLGCGDGRIVIAAAKKTGARAIGFDIDPEMVRISRENIKKERLSHLVSIEEKDIFEVDLSGASVIAMYLLSEINVRLIPQLTKLKPGSRIVSHDFDIWERTPDVQAFVYRNDGHRSKVFLYTTPLKKIELQEEYETRNRNYPFLQDFNRYGKSYRTDNGITFLNPVIKRQMRQLNR